MPSDTAITSKKLLTDEKMLDNLNTFIQGKSCVLLLGPLFGVDQNNEKIHQNLRNYLTGPENSLLLDDEFDNLYISKMANGSQNGELITGIAKYYQNLVPSDVYEKILAIGFRAIVSYTSDLLLVNANKNHEYDFSFFSPKGLQFNGEIGQNNDQLKRPIIYNIFGNNEDISTLITDYDSLYDFLINILKADQEIPLQLKNILSNARSFLFLGFDLKRWYVPLIIRKFNQFILNGGRFKGALSAYVCLDDTVDAPLVSISESLNRYPLDFEAFKDFTSVELINELYKLRKNTVTSDPLAPKPASQADIDFFKKWDAGMKNYGSEEGLQLFFREYKGLNYAGPFKKEIDLVNMKFNELCNQKYSGKVSQELFENGCSNITSSVFHFSQQIINP